MNHNNVKILMGHSSSMGLSKNYYKPTQKDVLQDYLKAIPSLTVEEENRLLKKITEYQIIEKEQDYMIKGILTERDEVIKELKQNELTHSDAITNLSDQINLLMTEINQIKSNR